MESPYEVNGTTPAPEAKRIESGHTPDELWRWRRAKEIGAEEIRHGMELVKWAEIEIQRLEKQ